MTASARCHAAGAGIQTVPITDCAVTTPELLGLAAARLSSAADARGGEA